MKNKETKLLYSILFLKGTSGVTIKELASLLKISEKKSTGIVDSLKNELIELDWPLEVKETEFKIRLTPNSKMANALQKNIDKTIKVSLSKSLLEVLTIIAYNQPTTKPEIESIRGVSCDHSISKLIEHNLIEAVGRSDLPGKPWLYKTTPYFLELFDLKSLKDLPSKDEGFSERTKETTLFVYEEDQKFNDK